MKHRYGHGNKAVVVATKSNGNKKSLLLLARGDLIKNERLTDIELDTIEAWITLAKLMGFDYDPSEAHEEQTP